MIEKSADGEREVEWKVGDRCIGIETPRLRLAGDRRGRHDDRRLRPKAQDLRHHGTRGDRFPDRHGVDPQVVLAFAAPVKPHPLRKVGEVLPPQESGDQEERQGDEEDEVQKNLVQDEHGGE